MASLLRNALLPPSAVMQSPVLFNVPMTVGNQVLKCDDLGKLFGDVPGGLVVFVGVSSCATPQGEALITAVFVSHRGKYTLRAVCCAAIQG
eukprot:1686013-Prymnesium_polylepis.1